MKKIYIISELCGQWGGSIRRAEQMILQSKMAGASAVKIQLYDTYQMPGENRERWEYLSITFKQFMHLKRFSDDLRIDFFASPFHQDRFEWIRKEGLWINKIASCVLDWDFEFCEHMVQNTFKTICSLGSWTKNELPFAHLKDLDIYYMHCVSKYPHSFDEAFMKMPKQFSKDTIIGYSDHSIGIESCMEAVDRGAKIIEKHFTTDHSLQCSTEGAHVCSMNMKQLEELRNYCDRTIR